MKNIKTSLNKGEIKVENFSFQNKSKLETLSQV